MSPTLRTWWRRICQFLWWHDLTMMEVSLLLRSAGWLVQIADSSESIFRSPALLALIGLSSRGFWLILCGGAVLVPIIALLLHNLILRILSLICYTFWWSFMAYVFFHVSPKSVTLADCIISVFLALWVLAFLFYRHRVPERLLGWVGLWDK